MIAPSKPLPAAPAAGLFGNGKVEPLALPREEVSANQRKSFADLFKGDGAELHAA